MQLVFLGEVLDGFQSDDVKRQLGQLLKLDDARLDKLFSGSRTVLKRSLEPADAHRYVARLAQIGARIHLEPSTVQGADSLSSGKAAPKPAASAPTVVASKSAPARTARMARLKYVIAGILAAGVVVLLVIFGLARPSRPAFPTAANLPSAEARAAFEGEYAAAPLHKVFAVSAGGAWDWQGGSASLETAFDKAIAGCEARRAPESPPCAPVNIDGEWVAREGG